MIAALTGGIGCGKSTVAAIFSELGWTVCDADAVCREFYRSGDPRITVPMVERWGTGIVGGDGLIDRRQVADRVFADPQELSWLNQLFHPLVQQRLLATAAECNNDFILCDIPLLFEAGWHTGFAAVIAVWTSPELQRFRLRQRGWDDREIDRRTAAQWSADKKLESADYGLINCGDQTDLKLQCIELNKIIKEMSWTK